MVLRLLHQAKLTNKHDNDNHILFELRSQVAIIKAQVEALEKKLNDLSF